MKFPEDWKLRWLASTHPRVQGFEAKLIHQCLLACGPSLRQLSAITVFEPRDLNEDFFNRWRKRREESPWAQQKFFLFYPEKFEHRVKQFIRPDEAHLIDSRPTSFLHCKNSPGGWMVRSRIRVINVDDSPVLLKLLKHGIESKPSFEVVGQVNDSREAVDLIRKLRPDAVTMDIQMPGLSGVDVVKDLLPKEYFPVLMVSSLSLEESSLVFEALQAGAFDYLQKPQVENREEFINQVEERLLHAVVGQGAHKALIQPRPKKLQLASLGPSSKDLIWLLGSSTGGTQALSRVLTSLPHEIPPTLIVQHIPPLYSKAFAESVDDLVPFLVKEAEHGEELAPNKVLIAPGGTQVSVRQVGSKILVQITDDPPVNRFKPSVDYLFERFAKLDGSFKVIAGILTGMGRDGAQGLLALKKRGALTFAQDEETSAVFGMPRAAIELGAADRVVSLDHVAETLLQMSLELQKNAA